MCTIFEFCQHLLVLIDEIVSVPLKQLISNQATGHHQCSFYHYIGLQLYQPHLSHIQQLEQQNQYRIFHVLNWNTYQ